MNHLTSHSLLVTKLELDPDKLALDCVLIIKSYSASLRANLSPFCRWENKIPRGWWLSGKESACQCRRHGVDPWLGKISWRRKWQPTPVFLPGKPHGQKSLLGHSPWDHKDSEMTEQLTQGMCPRSPNWWVSKQVVMIISPKQSWNIIDT